MLKASYWTNCTEDMKTNEQDLYECRVQHPLKFGGRGLLTQNGAEKMGDAFAICFRKLRKK